MTEPDPEAPPLIDAAFFENILEQDLANIVKKASSGQPLNKREREMMEEQRTRCLKISQPAFKLQGEGPQTALERMTQRELAEAWGASLRSVKGWMAKGREKGDPAPLTRPDEFPAWYARIHSPRQCPGDLLAAAQRLMAEGKAAPMAESVKPPSPPPEPIHVAEDEKGILAMLERYRIAEVTAHKKYMAALEMGDENKASFYMGEWTKVGEKLRALEKSAPQALEALGIFVRRDEVQRELEPLHSAILKSFKQALRFHRNRLKAAKDADEWNRISDAIVDETSLMLCENDFAEPLELEAV